MGFIDDAFDAVGDFFDDAVDFVGDAADDVGSFLGDAADVTGDVAGAVGKFVGDNAEEVATIGAIVAAPFTGGASLAVLPAIGPASQAIRGIAGDGLGRRTQARVFNPQTGQATGEILILPQQQSQPLIIPFPLPTPSAQQDFTPIILVGGLAIVMVFILTRK